MICLQNIPCRISLRKYDFIFVLLYFKNRIHIETKQKITHLLLIPNQSTCFPLNTFPLFKTTNIIVYGVFQGIRSQKEPQGTFPSFQWKKTPCQM